MIELDAELPDHRSPIKFKNMDKPCMVISSDKARQDAQNFREAATLMPSTTRGQKVAEWLNELAGKFERLEPEE